MINYLIKKQNKYNIIFLNKIIIIICINLKTLFKKNTQKKKYKSKKKYKRKKKYMEIL